jgi:hypothetical protein
LARLDAYEPLPPLALHVGHGVALGLVRIPDGQLVRKKTGADKWIFKVSDEERERERERKSKRCV